jgi:hypothetical protein
VDGGNHEADIVVPPEPGWRRDRTGQTQFARRFLRSFRLRADTFDLPLTPVKRFATESPALSATSFIPAMLRPRKRPVQSGSRRSPPEISMPSSR